MLGDMTVITGHMTAMLLFIVLWFEIKPVLHHRNTDYSDSQAM